MDPKKMMMAQSPAGDDRLAIKQALLEELRQFAHGGMAQELKSKYGAPKDGVQPGSPEAAPGSPAPPPSEGSKLAGASGGMMDLEHDVGAQGSGGELDLTNDPAAQGSGGEMDLTSEAGVTPSDADGDELAGLDEETLQKLLAQLGGE